MLSSKNFLKSTKTLERTLSTSFFGIGSVPGGRHTPGCGAGFRGCAGSCPWELEPPPRAHDCSPLAATGRVASPDSSLDHVVLVIERADDTKAALARPTDEIEAATP